ncbi:O-antigen ligase family protein [Microbacterium sp.]|uniref:O-antigen ligase family protein n=1 Tax=Microbacterium sp. TaxID=51671 RepID=UPI0025E8C8D0|nr:O-antigen ligase family protein [Microbacterium sp.]
MSQSTARAPVWRMRIADWWANAWRWVLFATGAALSGYFLLEQGVSNGIFTAGAIAALVIGASITQSKPMAIALMAMPALFIVERVALGGLGLSVSDVALAAAFGTAVLLGTRPYSRALRQLLWLNFFYQFTTLFTVIVNPYAANTVEWFHAWLLVSGAMVVGWALGRGGYARIALLLIVGTACVIAVGTLITGILQYASGDFGPVYPLVPLPIHKNLAGTAMAFAAVVAYANPDWMAWRKNWASAAFWLLILAILMTQSRQAIVGLIFAIVLIASRRGASGRSRLVLLLVIPGIWLVTVMVIEQVESQNQYNSVFQRLQWFREVYALWKLSPVFGHGLRYWYTDTTAAFQPPQAELEVLASAGLVGLVGFVAMWIGIIFVLWHVDPRFGTLALAVTLSRLVQGQFDLFWVAAQVSIPFVIAGICLGAKVWDESQARSARVQRMHVERR